MGRTQRFAVVGILWAFAFVIHYIAVELFQPGSILRTLTGGGSFGGQTAADLHADVYSYLALWIPLGIVVFGILWLLITEYQDQRVAAVVPPR